MGNFFHTILYVPLYNLLVFLVGVTGGDIGLAIILATIVVRLVLWPLSMSAAKSQRAMKAMQPEMKAVQEKYKDDKETQMKEVMALYKKYDIHPFASILPVFIQLPIVIGLYWVFRTESLPHIDLPLLYPFVHAPSVVSVVFLGLLTLVGHNLWLALLAALSQGAQAWYAVPVPPASAEVTSTPGDDFARALGVQTRFVLPVIIGVVAYASGAIALYFITSSLISLLQEFIARRTYKPLASSPLSA